MLTVSNHSSAHPPQSQCASAIALEGEQTESTGPWP